MFASNVLNGTVSRIDLSISENLRDGSATRIASSYAHRFDPLALVIGPTSLACDRHPEVSYVASTGDNKVFAIDQARIRRFVYTDNVHLRGPLALALAPNGHLIKANGDAVNARGTRNELVEFTAGGQFVAQLVLSAEHSGLQSAAKLTSPVSPPWMITKTRSASGPLMATGDGNDGKNN